MQPILLKLDLAHNVRSVSSMRGIGPFHPAMKPRSPPAVIRGVTRDAVGAPLASCALKVFRQEGTLVSTTTSDGSGNYVTDPVGPGQFHQIVAYKTGSPDVAGVTLNTLQGA